MAFKNIFILGIPTPNILTVSIISLNCGILINVPISTEGNTNSPTMIPITIATRYGNRFPYRPIMSNTLCFFLASSYFLEKLIIARNSAPTPTAIGYIRNCPESESWLCITVIGVAKRIPPLMEGGIAFIKRSASLVTPMKTKVKPTIICKAIIA